MSVLFTIELRVACDTDNKYVLAKQIVQQVALQAYANAMSLDGMREVRVCSDDYENGHRQIVLEELGTGDNFEIEEMSAHLSEALNTRRPKQRPVLRVIEGGKSGPHETVR
jgi:hypothetical protein